MTKEYNEPRIVGIKPAHDADDLGVSQDDPTKFQGTVRLRGWDDVNSVWRDVLVNADGKLIIDPSEIFENVPTDNEHGKAPDSDWAFDHDADPGAHHAKYTDAEARAVMSPVTVLPEQFIPSRDDYDFYLWGGTLRNRVSLAIRYFYAPLILPSGVTVTKLTCYGYRDDADALMQVNLYRSNRMAGLSLMGYVICSWTIGYSSGYDDTISLATINNAAYQYLIQLRLDPNNAVGDVIFSGVKIEFTG